MNDFLVRRLEDLGSTTEDGTTEHDVNNWGGYSTSSPSLIVLIIISTFVLLPISICACLSQVVAPIYYDDGDMMDSTTVATEEDEDLESGQEQETMPDGNETEKKRPGTRISRSDSKLPQSTTADNPTPVVTDGK